MGKRKKQPPIFEPIRTPLIDSHCHLAPHVFAEDTCKILARAVDSGLERIINIGAGYQMRGNYEVLEMASRDARLHPTIGIHPHDARVLSADPELLSELHSLAEKPEVVAYGEIGLDYHYELSSEEVQRAALTMQLELVRQIGKPLVIHVRDAAADLLSILDAANVWEQGVEFHCFSGDWSLAENVLSRGAYLGIPGIVTFKKAEAMQEVAARAPLERLLVETDSPYLAPVPYRGKRNEPSHVHLVVREIARLRGISAEEVARRTSENARILFKLPVT